MKYNTLIDSLDLRIASNHIPSAVLTERKQEWRRWQELAAGDISQQNYQVEIFDPGDEYYGLTGFWSLKQGGHRPYEFVLIHPEICDIRIWNPDKWDKLASRQTGQVYLSFRSKFLQYYGILGVEEIIRRICRFVFALPEHVVDEELFDELLYIRVSRGDLAADVSHGGFHWGDIHNFVSRCKYREADISGENLTEKALKLLDSKQSVSDAPPQRVTRGVVPTSEGGVYLSNADLDVIREALEGTREIGGELFRVCHNRLPQTLYFGRFSSPLYARIYNKLDSLKAQNKEYMREIWEKNGWDGESGVWRIEFSLSGDFLKNAIDITIENEETGEILTDLRDWNKFVAAIPQLWRYCTTKWLRYCERSPGDSNVWRGRVAQWWEEVANAFDGELTIFRKKLQGAYDDSQLVAQVKGVALTIAARRSLTDIPKDLAYNIVTRDLAQYFFSKEFDYDFLNRRRKLGIDEGIDDTLFSIEVRRRRMEEGNGS